MLARRQFLTGLFAAPAIIAADRLMPVKSFKLRGPPILLTYTDDLWFLPAGFQRGLIGWVPEIGPYNGEWKFCNEPVREWI